MYKDIMLEKNISQEPAIHLFEKLGYTVAYTSHKDDFDSIFDYKEVIIERAA